MLVWKYAVSFGCMANSQYLGCECAYNGTDVLHVALVNFIKYCVFCFSAEC